MPSLFTALKQYLRDAAPGGVLSPEAEPIAQYGRKVRGNVQGLLDDPAAFAKSAVLDVVPNRDESNAVLSQLMGRPYDQNMSRAYLDKMIDMGGLLGSIKVFHGSPHKFNKFDLSKIGTGEGAQAYGHGAYMAESPGVAKQYAESLSPLEIIHNGRSVGVFDKDAAANAAHQIRATGGDVDKAIKRAGNLYNGKWRDDVIAEIKRLGPGDVSERVDGSFYEANLRWPDAAREAADPMGPQHFLDWDKPLSQQPEAVRNVLSGFGVKSGETADEIAKRMISYGMSASDAMEYGAKNAYQNTGALAYAELGRDASASEKLRKAGIPGIRYLDAGSRGAGGTSNYVVFDDALIEILKRNGVAVK